MNELYDPDLEITPCQSQENSITIVDQLNSETICVGGDEDEKGFADMISLDDDNAEKMEKSFFFCRNVVAVAEEKSIIMS